MTDFKIKMCYNEQSERKVIKGEIWSLISEKDFYKNNGEGKTMIIRNGNVFQEDGSYRKMDLYVENGRIVSSEEEVSDKEEIDASGLKVLPGLVDIHSHGAVGHDFSDADATGLKKILKYESTWNYFLLSYINDTSDGTADPDFCFRDRSGAG